MVIYYKYYTIYACDLQRFYKKQTVLYYDTCANVYTCVNQHFYKFTGIDCCFRSITVRLLYQIYPIELLMKTSGCKEKHVVFYLQ